MNEPADRVVLVEKLSHQYRHNLALNDVSLSIEAGQMAGLIGPDGGGKSTLMALVAGAKFIQHGSVRVFDGDMRCQQHRNATCDRIAYMPQGLGKNLYSELSVTENLVFFARLFALGRTHYEARIERLLSATGLAPFSDRPAGKLSGGMKQKLGLCCALIHDPDLLLLDEPTTGVDPLSRQQFWSLIANIRTQRPGMTVLVSTAYMDEAENFDTLVAIKDGSVLASGSPEDLLRKTKSETLEEAFVRLLPDVNGQDHHPLEIPDRDAEAHEPIIVAEALTRKFGDFTAVDGVDFEIHRGEIFGFLGSNGCGKTTTMKILTGLLPASSGRAELFGERVDGRSLQVRHRVGYMSQSFSLYDELTVRQNLWLHARLFHLSRGERGDRIAELLKRFDLENDAEALASRLPLGVRQRLSLAVAIIHRPEILILDEPTSGVDPLARDRFWQLLVDLSRKQEVTIFISTHFVNEGERCDRVSLMHAGRVLACDTPNELIRSRDADDFEDAFVGYLRDAVTDETSLEEQDREIVSTEQKEERDRSQGNGRRFRLTRLLAYARRESLEIRRDPARLTFAFLGSVLLMIVFGFGITMDVDEMDFAVLDQDHSPESTEYIEALRGSRYFDERSLIRDRDDAVRKLRANRISVAIEVPPNFGRDLRRGDRPSVSFLIDGADPSRAATVESYAKGFHNWYLQQWADQRGESGEASPPIEIQSRFWYNPTFESIYAIVPSIPAILLIFIPAILMAVSVVREKELGSITNFYVTPSTRLEFLLGKQLPYIAIGFLNFVLLTIMSVLVFEVDVRGSLPMLMACAVVYVTVTTGIGLVISSFTSSQVAAVFVTTVVTILPTIQFSGLLQPVSTLEGMGRWIGTFWPTTYYMHASVGAFTKRLSSQQLWPDLIALLAFVPVLTWLAAVTLPKQDK
jgi:ribosome-dependent ATPase